MLNDPLRNVMTQGYLYVEEYQSAGKALGVMRDMRISCVFVLQDNKPSGIITERKIMKIAVSGSDVCTAAVKDVMSSPLISLTPEHTIGDACALIAEKEIRHLGIVDTAGRLKGTVTSSNIVNLMGSESFSSTALVRDVMFPNLVLLEEKSNLKEAGSAILEARSCCAIVMSEGYPVGIVSEKDVVRCLGFGQNISSVTLDRVMSKPVIGVEEKDTIAQAIITLRRHRIHRLVVYNDQGRVSGILALNGLVRNIHKILH
ncbi:CBS domain-containing protein [Desulfopila inferna]|uniref:CBS domain-containing protein n=1 Tax=Desulfopila inferna TaxID=468528 RepID=UPI001963C373|nr:CBS domain-containing protein [Desulfopila inferna]MBM9605196.1 CBS domain-containing protein [Desulfopila inferna]